jgi:competence protein ComEC
MLNIHFLNVGKGSCTIIDFPSGNLSMIDIDNLRAKYDPNLTDPLKYLDRNFSGRSLFRFILTHPDMDHMSGLDELYTKTSILNFWDTDHNKTLPPDDWEQSPYNAKDWTTYQKLRRSTENPKCLKLHRDASSTCCWTQDGIAVLSPSSTLVKLADETEEYNHLSYVLMVEYAGVKVLLAGDSTVEAWDEISNSYDASFLKCDILQAPHHGSPNNIHEEALALVAPDYVIVSVAEGVDYDYQYYSQLAKEGVLSTKRYGTIQVSIQENGTYLPIIVERK